MRRVSVFPLALALATFAACKSSPAEKGAATGKSVDEASAEVDRALAQLDVTLASLDELVGRPAPDLHPQYKAFTKNLDQLEASAEKVLALGDKIEGRRQAYFAEWDGKIAEVNDEELRERSAERREVVAANFQKLQDEYAELRADFDPLLSDLGDIEKALSADLTMEGLKTVADTVGEAHHRGDVVKESLHDLARNFRDLSVRLRQGAPLPPVPAEPAPEQ